MSAHIPGERKLQTTITAKLPDKTAIELDELVSESMIPKSVIIREALRRFLKHKDTLTIGRMGTQDNY